MTPTRKALSPLSPFGRDAAARPEDMRAVKAPRGFVSVRASTGCWERAELDRHADDDVAQLTLIRHRPPIARRVRCPLRSSWL